MELFKKYSKDALKHIQIADHLMYVTLPIVNEKRLLVKIFEEIYKSILNSVNAVVRYEVLLGRIKPTNDEEQHLLQFFKLAKNYTISHEQLKNIQEIIEIHKKHSESPMEFVKKEKVVIMSSTLSTKTVDQAQVKGYLLIAKELFMTVTKRIKL